MLSADVSPFSSCNQGITKWVYQYTHLCFVTFHHGLLTFTIMENQGNTRWVYGPEKHIFTSTLSWFTAASILPLSGKDRMGLFKDTNVSGVIIY